MSKTPLLLLHGVTRSGASVAPLEAALAGRYELRAPDFPGHGSAQRRPGRYAVVDHAEAAGKWLVGEPAIVYGHSMGAMAAALLAAEFPGRVEALILEDPPFHTMGSRIADSALLSLLHWLATEATVRLALSFLLSLEEKGGREDTL